MVVQNSVTVFIWGDLSDEVFQRMTTSVANFVSHYIVTEEELWYKFTQESSPFVLLWHYSPVLMYDRVQFLRRFKQAYPQCELILYGDIETVEESVSLFREGVYDLIIPQNNEKDGVSVVTRAVQKVDSVINQDMALRMLTHDLKTPLQILSASGEMLGSVVEDDLGRDDIKLLLRAFHNGVYDMSLMLNNISAVAKLEQNVTEEFIESFVVNDLLREAVEDSNIQWNMLLNEMHFVNNIPNECSIYSNRVLVKQVFMNIFNNIIHHSIDKKMISFEVRTITDGVLQLRVQQRGITLLDGYSETIFQKYSPIHKEYSHSIIRNNGLGLTFCKLAIERLGGKVWVAYDPLETVVTFNVVIVNSLPVCNPIGVLN